MSGKSQPEDDLPASDADLVKKARKENDLGGTPPADPASQAGRDLSHRREKSRGAREAERIERLREKPEDKE